MLEFALKGELYKQLSKTGTFGEKRSSRVGHRFHICCVRSSSLP